MGPPQRAGINYFSFRTEAPRYRRARAAMTAQQSDFAAVFPLHAESRAPGDDGPDLWILWRGNRAAMTKIHVFVGHGSRTPSRRAHPFTLIAPGQDRANRHAAQSRGDRGAF